MTSPVLTALATARAADWSANERSIAATVAEQLGEFPRSTDGAERKRFVEFKRWCDGKRVCSCPARPATVALFVLESVRLSVASLAELLDAIACEHHAAGLANPVTTWVVSEALGHVWEIEPPRAWPKEQKTRFAALPLDVRTFIFAHEVRRDIAIRSAHNDRAQAIRDLETERSKNCR